MRKFLLLTMFVSLLTHAQDPATALNFDGTNDYVNVGTDNVFNYTTTSTFTIEAWIKPSTTATTWKIIAARESWNAGEGWVFHASNKRLYFRTPNEQVLTNQILTDDVWTHVAVTFSATNVIIYKDGVDVAAGNISITSSPSQDMYIGARHFNGGTGSTDFFAGDIDDVRFWSTVRTRTEILGNKDCALSGTEADLLSYYNANQGFHNHNNSTETVFKSSNATYDGTLNNFTLSGTASNFMDGSDNGVDSCDTLSAETNELTSGISLFPNPAHNEFNLRNDNNTKLASATITDLNGRIVSKVDLRTMQTVKKINISNLRSGLYLVQIMSKNASITKKLILQ